QQPQGNMDCCRVESTEPAEQLLQEGLFGHGYLLSVSGFARLLLFLGGFFWNLVELLPGLVGFLGVLVRCVALRGLRRPAERADLGDQFAGLLLRDLVAKRRHLLPFAAQNAGQKFGICSLPMPISIGEVGYFRQLGPGRAAPAVGSMALLTLLMEKPA